jgi:hypothetical protein
MQTPPTVHAVLPNLNVRLNGMGGEQGYALGTPYWASDMFNGCAFLGFAVTSAIALARCVQLDKLVVGALLSQTCKTCVCDCKTIVTFACLYTSDNFEEYWPVFKMQQVLLCASDQSASLNQLSCSVL